MNCPFCDAEMEFWDYTNERCANKECRCHGMSRYIRYNNSIGDLVGEIIILTDTMYVTVDYEEDTTTVSKLDIVVISDHIKLPRALRLDLKNYQAALDKIKTLLIFS